MSTDPTSALPGWQRDRLAVLLEALNGVRVSDAERRSLQWLSGWEPSVIENIAALITRARQTTREGGR